MSSTAPAQSGRDSRADNQSGRRWRWYARALLVPVMMLANYLPLLLLNMTGVRQPANPSETLRALFTLPVVLVTLISVLFVYLAMRFLDHRPLRDAGLFFDARSVPAFLVGWAASAVVILPTTILLTAAGLLRPVESQGSFSPWFVALGAFATGVLMQGFPEELQWRGYLTQTLPFRSPWAIALFSAGLFGLMHLASNGGQQNAFERVLYILQAFGFAFLAAALYRATGQLWAAVGVHGGLHLTNAYVASLNVGEGPVLWVAQALGYLVLGVVVMVWLDRRRPETAALPWARPGIGSAS